MDPVRDLPPPPLGRSIPFASRSPATYAALVGVGYLVFWAVFALRTNMALLQAALLGIAMGALFGFSNYLRIRPVRPSFELRLFGTAAIATWIAGIAVGCDLFQGGVLTLTVVGTTLRFNRIGLRAQRKAAEARAAWQVPAR